MSRSVLELKELCLARNLDSSKCRLKSDYRKLLAQSYATEETLEQVDFMRAKDFKSLEPCAQVNILDSPNWIAEEFLSGNRIKVHVQEVGLRFDGVQVSEETYIYVELTNDYAHLKYLNFLGVPPLTVFDSVMQEKDGKFCLGIFDIIRWGGVVVKSVYYKRKALLRRMISPNTHLANVFKINNIFLVDFERDKRKLFKKVVLEGGKGVMLKNLNGRYREGKKSTDVLTWYAS